MLLLLPKRSSLVSLLAAGILGGALLSAAAPARAIAVGQVDDFQDGTTQGWVIGPGGSPVPPENVASGGPGGAGDGYLRLQSLGAGRAGSRLVVFNQAQWTGDWLAAGVAQVTLDVDNRGSTDLELRLSLDGAGRFYSTATSVAVAAGSGWQSISFAVRPSDWVPITSGNILDALADVDELRLLHSPFPSYAGPPEIAADLGVDNIAAVPEPGTAALVVLGLIGLAAGRR